VTALNSEPNGAWTNPGTLERLALLLRTKTVAVVGVSGKPQRASNFVATYLLASTAYDVYFVNPHETEVLGRPVYPTLAALPIVPDLVDVFRKPADLPGVLADAIDVGATTLWLQFGLFVPEIARKAEAAGLTAVMDRCLKIEHARFHGGLHLAGFNTGVISSRKQTTGRRD
jgi:uncharacterized protein